MKKVFFFIVFVSIFLTFSLPAMAEEITGINATPLRSSSCLYNGGAGVGKIVTLDCIPVLFMTFVFYALMFAGLVALFLIVFSGIRFITSGGDPKKIEGARNVVVWAIIGLVLVFFSFGIVRFVSTLTGVECISKIGFLVCDTSGGAGDPDTPVDTSPESPDTAPIFGSFGDKTEGSRDRLDCQWDARVCEGNLCGCVRDDGGKCYSPNEYCGPQRECKGNSDDEGFIGLCTHK